MIDIEQLNYVGLIAAFLLGALLGGIYFGGLWLTLRYLASHRWSTLLYIVSLVARMALLGYAIYLVLAISNWIHVLTMLLGFIIVRVFLLRRLGFATTPTLTHTGKERSS